MILREPSIASASSARACILPCHHSLSSSTSSTSYCSISSVSSSSSPGRQEGATNLQSGSAGLTRNVRIARCVQMSRLRTIDISKAIPNPHTRVPTIPSTRVTRTHRVIPVLFSSLRTVQNFRYSCQSSLRRALFSSVTN